MGKAFKYGDNIDTDVIIPARYLTTPDMDALKIHAMEDIDKDFAKSVQKGDIIVAGKNFGCGSSREHAPAVLKACGIEAVIAKSFARIFFRNAVNIGLTLIENSQIMDETSENDVLTVDLAKNEVENHTSGKTYTIPPQPEFLKRIVEAGGLMATLTSK